MASRVPDRSRRDGMGDTARFGGVRASFHAAHRVVRALRWRRRSSSDNNGTPRAAGGRALLDRPAQLERVVFASGVTRPRISRRFERSRRFGVRGSPDGQPGKDAVDIGSECREGCPICVWTDPDDDVGSYVGWQEARSGKLSQAALHAVPGDCRLTESWNDQPNASSRSRGKHERGSDDPNLEQRGSDTLPLLRDALELRASCDACTSRKSQRRAGRLRLRRTCPGCGPSAASAPSSDDGQGSSDPTLFPYAHGIRAS
jgi:hypothetical protein